MADYTKYERMIEDKQGRAKHLTDTAVAEKREMTDSEVREHEALYGEISSLRAVVEDLKNEEITDLRERIDSQSHAEARFSEPRSDGQFFRGMGEGEVRTIHGPESRAWSSASGASGMLSEEWHDSVLKYLFEASVARTSGMQVIRTSHTHNIPIMSAYGSAGAVIVAENTAYTEDDPTVTRVQMGAYKFVKKVRVAEEVMADFEYPIEALLAEAAGVAFGQSENTYFISSAGTGTSTPSGLFSLAATASCAAGTTGPTADELIRSVYELPRQYRTKDAAWFMTDTLLGVIARLRATPSAVESLLWQDAVNGEPARLFGYPVYTGTNFGNYAASGTKCLVFGNTKFYMIGERGPLEVKRLTLDEYSTIFAFSKRMDGHPLTSSAFVVLKTLT